VFWIIMHSVSEIVQAYVINMQRFHKSNKYRGHTTYILQGDLVSTLQCHYQAPEYSKYKRKHL
jgi:hypothetical protein